ncbi:MAG: CPBP family intramembrane metalloprotease [Methylococcaceae bacterium]|nr:CPBP family intramembrane metalloprotease [Methylococcaceae bacterium]
MFDPAKPADRASFLKIASLFEGGLVVAAYLIGWLGDVDPLANLRPELKALSWGLAGTVPLYLLFLLSYHIPVGRLHAIKRFLIERMGPLLDACHWRDLLYLGLLAGITEEILFRGVLQPMMEASWGWTAGIVASNILFAMAHFVTPCYALLAGLTGVYLGFALDFGGERNLLTPILIHAIYDFLAFLAVARTYRAERSVYF